MRKRWQVLERVVNIVKLIGKRTLSYRGNKSEAAHSLADMLVDHGNFLDILLLLSKYDSCWQQHVQECIEKSRAGKGRGTFVTLLSKITEFGCGVYSATNQREHFFWCHLGWNVFSTNWYNTRHNIKRSVQCYSPLCNWQHSREATYSCWMWVISRARLSKTA